MTPEQIRHRRTTGLRAIYPDEPIILLNDPIIVYATNRARAPSSCPRPPYRSWAWPAHDRLLGCRHLSAREPASDAPWAPLRPGPDRVVLNFIMMGTTPCAFVEHASERANSLPPCSDGEMEEIVNGRAPARPRPRSTSQTTSAPAQEITVASTFNLLNRRHPPRGANDIFAVEDRRHRRQSALRHGPPPSSAARHRLQSRGRHHRVGTAGTSLT